MSYTARQVAKAITGTAGAFLTGLIAGAADGHLTLLEWLVAAAAGVASGGAVFGVQNDKTKA